MITVEFEGLEEFLKRLELMKDEISRVAMSLVKMMGEVRRVTQDISPVITGSYRASHRITHGEMWAAMDIDPMARNIESDILVVRYAGPVEERHRVYAQSWHVAERMAVQLAKDLGGRLVYGN